ncbi:MAG: hypothetical protein MH186_10895 [Marinobacter sp.]|nr:hypothetical protein [Marinobacter sp.]
MLNRLRRFALKWLRGTGAHPRDEGFLHFRHKRLLFGRHWPLRTRTARQNTHCDEHN